MKGVEIDAFIFYAKFVDKNIAIRQNFPNFTKGKRLSKNEY